jgi:1-acyl-sn-glycerol-3-phosphate acyltransferase
MRTLGSLWSWLTIALVASVGCCLQAVLLLVTFPFDRRRYLAGRWFRLMGIAAARLVPSWRFGVHGHAPRGIAGRTVCVSNHESNADPFLISFLPWEMKWLYKSSLGLVPFVGWSMWLAGDVPVHRGERDSAAAAMARCKQWLDQGMPIMIFPEGTRSKDGTLGAFKDGAFRLAIDAGADLLPLAISGTRTALPKHSWKFGDARARVSVGRPIETAGKTVEALKQEARAQIEELVAQMRAG